MKKKVLVLLLGGVMAVGSLSMQVPVTVQANEESEWLEEESRSSNSDAAGTVQADEEPGWLLPEEACGYNSDTHILSHEVAVVDGGVEVTLDLKFHANDYGNPSPVRLYFYERPLKLKDGERLGLPGPYYDINSISYDFNYDVIDEHFQRNFGTYWGGEANITYYIYAEDLFHHTPTYLGYANPWTGEAENASIPDPNLASSSSGSTTPGSSSSGSTTPGNSSSDSVGSDSNTSDSGRVKTGSDFYRKFESEVCSQIQAAESGSTFVMEKGITTLSNAMMKELLAKGDVSLKLEFTYNEQEYVIVIPAGAALDNDIPWYGPLYLTQQYGNSVGTGED